MLLIIALRVVSDSLLRLGCRAACLTPLRSFDAALKDVMSRCTCVIGQRTVTITACGYGNFTTVRIMRVIHRLSKKRRILSKYHKEAGENRKLTNCYLLN